MIVSVFVRRLKGGRTFDEFLAEWEADPGFDAPTRVFNAPSIDDPRDVITIGFVTSRWRSSRPAWPRSPHRRPSATTGSTR